MAHPLSLAVFPLELILHIASYLPPRGISHLSQTCSPLRDTLQPLVFRAYTHGSHPVSRLTSFLRALVSRPDLAAAVTSLAFRDPLDWSALTSADITFVDACFTDRGVPPPPENWHLEGDTESALLEAVLAHTPNLRALELSVNEAWTLDSLDAFRLHFPHLRSLSVSYYYISGDRWAVTYAQIDPFLVAAPNLRHLALPSLEGFYEAYSHQLPPLDNVTSLDLGESASGAFLNASLIASCPRLRRFSLHWLSATGYDESSEDWSLLEIWDALHSKRSTLEELVFEASSDIPAGSPTQTSISSLAGFTHLRVLKINGASLWLMYQAWKLTHPHGDEAAFVEQLLPSSLTSLTVWEPSADLIPVLLSLAEVRLRLELYDGLEHVQVGPSPVFKHWAPRPEWRDTEPLLRERYARAGVRLELEIPYVDPVMQRLFAQFGMNG